MTKLETYRCKNNKVEREIVIAFFRNQKSIYDMMKIVPLCAIEDMVSGGIN